MIKNPRFAIGLVLVASVVSYLVWTGVRETMVFYLTPTELVAKAGVDPGFANVGVKVSGKVVPGTVRSSDDGEILHRFEVGDLVEESVRIPVEFRDPLPDTFEEDGEVVVEGRFAENGVFYATSVLTKCGSRYEAAPEGYQAGAGPGYAPGDPGTY